jgi:long-chain acyl-CoA synthetase
VTVPSTDAAQPRSLGELLRRAAAQRGDQLAVIDDNVRWTWSELEATVTQLAAALVSYGLERDDRIAVQALASADFVALYLGALQAGLVVVPVNPGYTIPELSHILDDSGSRVLVTSSAATVAAAETLRAQHPLLERILVAGRSDSAELPTVTDLLAAGNGQPEVRRDRAGEEVAVLLYTSGTSGKPKGAMLPVRALLANQEQLAELSPLTADDRVFLPLPLFHIFGLNAGLGMALYYGATAVLSSKFEATATLQTIVDEKVTVILGAPVEFAVWAAQPNFASAFAGVRYALSGSAPLLPELVNAYDNIGVGLFEGYGLTEAAPVVTSNLIPLADRSGWSEPKAGSIGRPLPDVEVRLIDDSGEAVEAGDLGLLEVRGANLFVGYWPDRSGGPDDDGWFATGDLAVCDDDGDYYLVGRRNDLVLVNGFNVYPAEVEAVLSKLVGVHEVAVLGEPDENGSEAVVAYIVPEAGSVLDPDEIIAAAARSLARFKLPKRIVEVTSLPHTATGKVMKWRLRTAAGDSVSAS